MDNKTQIDNYLKHMREKERGLPSVTYHDITEWYDQCSAPPNNDHVYVLKHLVDDSLGLVCVCVCVCVMLGTKALQRVAKNSKVIHTDATYKLTW